MSELFKTSKDADQMAGIHSAPKQPSLKFKVFWAEAGELEHVVGVSQNAEGWYWGWAPDFDPVGPEPTSEVAYTAALDTLNIDIT